MLGIGGFFKFLFPPLLIFWGIRRSFSAGFMAVGAFGALICASVVLWLWRRAETKALVS